MIIKNDDEEIEMIVKERIAVLHDKFLTDISHELRTPITSIKLAVTLMKLQTCEIKCKQYLDIIEYESERQIKYISKLLSDKE